MANFNLFIPEIQIAEGGYQDYSSDAGNYNSLNQNVGTNYGINAKVYEQFIGRPPTVQDMQNMSSQTALNIFKNQYWDKIKGDYIASQPVAETLVDMTINAGSNGIKIMQRTLNQLGHNLVVDGGFGNLTLSAVNQTNERDLFLTYNQNRLAYYDSLQFTRPNTWLDFKDSWKNRVEHLYNKHINFLNQIATTITTTINENPKSSLISLGVYSLIAITIYRTFKK